MGIVFLLFILLPILLICDAALIYLLISTWCWSFSVSSPPHAVLASLVGFFTSVIVISIFNEPAPFRPDYYFYSKVAGAIVGFSPCFYGMSDEPNVSYRRWKLLGSAVSYGAIQTIIYITWP